jgi:hypothetical protein
MSIIGTDDTGGGVGSGCETERVSVRTFSIEAPPVHAFPEGRETVPLL